MSISSPKAKLSSEQLQKLTLGHHETVAQELSQAGTYDAAAWVLEQIWDFTGAFAHYRSAGCDLDALRVALEITNPAPLDQILSALEHRAQQGDTEILPKAVALLQKRGRQIEASRLLAHQPSEVETRVMALQQAGAYVAAARVLAEAGRLQEAYQSLPIHELDPRTSISASQVPLLSYGATLAWKLGDAQAAVRFAQKALQAQDPQVHREDPELLTHLALGLQALGYEVAASLILQQTQATKPVKLLSSLPGRYQVQRPIPSSFPGNAFAGLDRVLMQEVEIYLLLSEYGHEDAMDPTTQECLQKFTATATAAAQLGHPAIRPILHIDSSSGLLILTQAEGPSLQNLIRPPGLAAMPYRALALVRFLLEGLHAAHRRGIVHGFILPSQIVCDVAGRPLLGPFGSHYLRSLAATHTTALEELRDFIAPEVQRGHSPTTASDVYTLAAIYRALLGGSIDAHSIAANTFIRALDSAPEGRPEARELVKHLQVNVADISKLGASLSVSANEAMVQPPTKQILETIHVQAHPSWTNSELDQLLAYDYGVFQPVLDRQGRSISLATWPADFHRQANAKDPFGFVHTQEQVLCQLPPSLHTLLRRRIQPSSWVCSPTGQWMLALDELLTR